MPKDLSTMPTPDAANALTHLNTDQLRRLRRAIAQCAPNAEAEAVDWPSLAEAVRSSPSKLPIDVPVAALSFIDSELTRRRNADNFEDHLRLVAAHPLSAAEWPYASAMTVIAHCMYGRPGRPPLRYRRRAARRARKILGRSLDHLLLE